MVDLSGPQKDKIAKQVTYGATAGGWFLVGMALFVVALFVWYLWQRASGQVNADGTEGMVAFLMLGLAFAGLGVWLLSRRYKTRRELDGPLTAGTAEIIIDSGLTENGWTMTLNIITPADLSGKASIGGYGRPTWQVGDTIELVFLPNDEYFFPKNIDYNGDMGYRITAERIGRRRRYMTLGLIIFIVLAGLGFLIGLWNQMNGG